MKVLLKNFIALLLCKEVYAYKYDKKKYNYKTIRYIVEFKKSTITNN